MSIKDLTLVASGAILLGYVVIGLFFCRFWSRTRERLFAYFAMAFWILAIERVLLLSVDRESTQHPPIYITRLIAFLVIIWAVWDKNRAARKR